MVEISNTYSKSRTGKSLKNVQVATFFYFVNLVLQFFSRKVFLEYLGSEVLGLNTTAQNLLGFLNIAELGIGTAVAYNLYKPLHDKDKQAIIDIVTVQGWIYRRIAFIVALGAIILMCFFPIMFAKANIPLWYAYGSFIVLLFGALLDYSINYKQIVLSADQKQYKITYSVQSVKIVKIILQILAIRFLLNGYLYWLILEIIMAIVTALVLNIQIKREYPWLHINVKEGKRLHAKYPNIIKKTKQVFFHKIGSFVLGQTTPLIIYGFATLTLVAIYGNYMLIVTAAILLMDALFNGIGGGIGNLVAEGNKSKILEVYWELVSARIWVASIFCTTFYMAGDQFISLWIGSNYILPKLPLILLIMTAFIRLTRTNDAFINAYGLFQDIWAPIIEAALNIGLSVLLGYISGLSGILTGVLISQLLIICIWKPYFLFKNGFKESIFTYIARFGKLMLAAIIISMTFCLLFRYYPIETTSYWDWIKNTALIVIILTLISFIVFYIIDVYFKSFIRRIISYVLIH